MRGKVNVPLGQGKKLKSRVEKCPDCLELCLQADWLAPSGIDPHLKQFNCTRCGSTFYVSKAILWESEYL